jgi:tRNA U34 5-carboxymethylaminomethyl modifying GTPase MnmE/TrmE
LSAALVELLRSGRLERSASRESASARRREVLGASRRALARAEAALAGGLGLACAADDLREAARAVALHFEPGAGRIGLDERVLNRIFARFCVGK